MLKKLAESIREYKLPSILTFIFILCEAVIECFIPLITARLVNKIDAGVDMSVVVSTGLILFGLALASLCCGGIAGITSAKASAVFAKNLRGDIFHNVQTYSFENIDKFSSASLVTRMTTDVSNVQIAYMMLIRTAVRLYSALLWLILWAAHWQQHL